MIAVWTRFRTRARHNWNERGKVGVMRRVQDSRSIGQKLYEIAAVETKSTCPEWRDQPPAYRAWCEKVAEQLIAKYSQRQEEQEES
jgi:hypothetical protein